MTIEIGGLAKEYFRIVSPTFIYGFLFFLVRRPPSYRPRGFWRAPLPSTKLFFYKNYKLIEIRTGCNKTDVNEAINSLDPSCDGVSNTVLVHLSMSGYGKILL